MIHGSSLARFFWKGSGDAVRSVPGVRAGNAPRGSGASVPANSWGSVGQRFFFILLLLLSGPTASLAAENTPEHLCDRIAADPIDYVRVAPPVDDLKFLPKQAVVACREAVAAYPDEPRFRFQLGRALLALGNLDKAREALQGAADRGYAVANLYLGRTFESMSYGEPDAEKAFEYYQSAAEQGHQDAQIGLGLLYLNGTGVEAAPQRAFYWFQKAADQGNPHAHFFLGRMYATGKHGVYDLKLAAEHARVAANAGVPAGQFALGHAYLLGVGVEKDPARGRALMEAAAEQGFTVAAITLGNLYMRGEEVPRDQEQAIRWFCKAGAAGRTFFQETYNEPLACREPL